LKVEEGKTGFYEKASHAIVEIETCLLLPQIVEDFIKEVRGNPLIKKVKKGEIFILSSGKKLSALLKADGSITHLGGQQKIPFTIGDFVYYFSPDNFVQANLFTLETMTGLVRKNLSEDYFKKAVDLFCGTGFFTPVLARKAGRVTAIEAGKKNIRSLETNLAANNIDNVDISRADILKTAVPSAGLYVIDPPRTGLTKKVVKSITAFRPKKILYFSCDSATFARDASYFQNAGYIIKELKIIDNFPQTDHFEIFSQISQ
jgi:23S rRNA (uracil1939-C5)-methyltransferase